MPLGLLYLRKLVAAMVTLPPSVSHRGLDEQNLLFVVGPHDVTKAQFRADCASTRDAQGAACKINPGLLVVDIISHRPLALVVDQVREVLIPLRHDFQIAFTKQIQLTHPARRRSTLEVGNLDGVAFSRFEHDLLFDRCAGRPRR